jgi:uncharacterized membrane protein YqaE (UPF0057 family)
MKKIAFFTVPLIFALLVSSCSFLGNHGFSKQKYTGFKRGGGSHQKELIKKVEVSGSDKSVATVQSEPNLELVEPFSGGVNVLTVPTCNTGSNVEKTTIEKGFRINPGSKSIFKKRAFASGSASAAADPTVMLIIMVILCFIIPPLAIFIKEKATGRFWLDLILALIGSGFLWFGGYGWGLAWAAAVVIALLVLFDAI